MERRPANSIYDKSTKTKRWHHKTPLGTHLLISTNDFYEDDKFVGFVVVSEDTCRDDARLGIEADISLDEQGSKIKSITISDSVNDYKEHYHNGSLKRVHNTYEDTFYLESNGVFIAASPKTETVTLDSPVDIIEPQKIFEGSLDTVMQYREFFLEAFNLLREMNVI